MPSLTWPRTFLVVRLPCGLNKYQGWLWKANCGPGVVLLGRGSGLIRTQTGRRQSNVSWHKDGDFLHVALQPMPTSLNGAFKTRIFATKHANTNKARFLTHRERIIARGIAADAHQPEWCHQNEGLCYLKKKE